MENHVTKKREQKVFWSDGVAKLIYFVTTLWEQILHTHKQKRLTPLFLFPYLKICENVLVEDSNPGREITSVPDNHYNIQLCLT